MTNKLNTGPTPFFTEMAEIEASCGTITPGGFLVDQGLWQGNRPPTVVPGAAFSRLLELWRRRMGWTLEQFAQHAEVDTEDLLMIEMGMGRPPSPRTVFQIAKVTEIPVGKLMELSGLATPRSGNTREAAVRFAAQSESMAKLSAQEDDALQTFIRILSDPQRGVDRL